MSFKKSRKKNIFEAFKNLFEEKWFVNPEIIFVKIVFINFLF